MAVPAQCANCANDPAQTQNQNQNQSPNQSNPANWNPNPTQPPANLGVVLGVLGGCALVALVVAIAVPLVRRRRARAGSGSNTGSVRRSLYSKVLDGDVERGADATANARAGANGRTPRHLPSRRSSLRHQKLLAGPDAQPLLLPLLLDPLRPISALTWSDLHSRRSRSKSPGPRTQRASITSASTEDDGSSLAMSDEDDFDATDRDRASLATDRATTSHRSTSSRSARERELAYRRIDQGRPPSAVSGGDGDGRRVRALPVPPRSPTPPGLPSKREYSIVHARRQSLPLPISPTSPADARASLFAPAPAPPRLLPPIPSPGANTPAAAGLSRHPSSRRAKPGMEPVYEDSAADGSAYADSRSLQLPSPPASPEQPQPQPALRAPSSSSASRRRPSLTPSQSAPAPTSYRPRSSTGPAIPLTAAFQTSVLRSGSGSSVGTGVSRYPSIVTGARPSSVQVGGASGLLSPESPDMSRPTEAFRRMSTTDIRHRHPSRALPQPGEQDGGEGRAFLRHSEAPRTTQVQPGVSTAYDPRAATLAGPSFTTPPPNPLSPPALAPTPPRLSLPVHPHSRASVGGAGPSNVTWRGSSSALPLAPQQQTQYPPAGQQTYPPYQQQQQQQQQMYQQPQFHQQQQQQQQQYPHQGQQAGSGGPALVRRKDSNALRPLPVSALMGAPPSAMSSLGGGSRSRSNSVRSTRTGAGPAVLPPLEPVAPLTMSLRSSPEDEEERRKERERERK